MVATSIEQNLKESLAEELSSITYKNIELKNSVKSIKSYNEYPNFTYKIYLNIEELFSPYVKTVLNEKLLFNNIFKDIDKDELKKMSITNQIKYLNKYKSFNSLYKKSLRYFKSAINIKIHAAIQKICNSNEAYKKFFNEHTFKFSISTSYSKPVVTISIKFYKIIHDSFFKRPMVVFDDKENMKIIKTLKNFFPYLQIPDNSNVSNIYFNIKFNNFLGNTYIAKVKKFNKTTNAINFILLENLEKQNQKGSTTKIYYNYKFTSKDKDKIIISIDDSINFSQNLDLF